MERMRLDHKVCGNCRSSIARRSLYKHSRSYYKKLQVLLITQDLHMPRKERGFDPIDIFLATILLLLLPIVLLIAIPVIHYRTRTVWRPIYLSIHPHLNTWLTWHDARRISGRSSKQVLETLAYFVVIRDLCETRLRDPMTVTRLRKRFNILNPAATKTMNADQAMLYEFKLRSHQPRRRKKKLWEILLPNPDNWTDGFQPV